MTKDSVTPASLDALRAEIDTIDRNIQHLIRRRAEVVLDLGAIKKAGGGGQALRPGREAQVLRHLAASHEGPFPLPPLFGVWRTMMTAYLRLQQPIEIHVAAAGPAGEGGDLALWDAARVHFGAGAPMSAVSATAALDAAAGSDNMLAVLPAPTSRPINRSTGRDDWWTRLSEGGLQVLARLPFLAPPGDTLPAAFVVARLVPEASGDDISLLTLSGPLDAIDGAVGDLGAAVGLELSTIAAYNPPDGRAAAMRLVAVESFLDPAGASARALGDAARTKEIKIEHVGCFARPLTPPREA